MSLIDSMRNRKTRRTEETIENIYNDEVLISSDEVIALRNEENFMQEVTNISGDKKEKMSDVVNEGILSDDKIRELIAKEFNTLRDFVLEKNKKYKNSVFYPQKIFCKDDNIKQIRVRIDDKLSRIKNLEEDDDEDSIKDLIGYLILLKVAMGQREKLSKKISQSQIESRKSDAEIQEELKSYMNSPTSEK